MAFHEKKIKKEMQNLVTIPLATEKNTDLRRMATWILKLEMSQIRICKRGMTAPKTLKEYSTILFDGAFHLSQQKVYLVQLC